MRDKMYCNCSCYSKLILTFKFLTVCNVQKCLHFALMWPKRGRQSTGKPKAFAVHVRWPWGSHTRCIMKRRAIWLVRFFWNPTVFLLEIRSICEFDADGAPISTYCVAKTFKKNLTSQSTKNGSLHAQEAPGGVVLCFEGQVRIFARSLLPARLVLRCFGGYKPLRIRTSNKLPNSRNKNFASPLSYPQGAGPDSKRLLQTVCQRALSSKPENPVLTSLMPISNCMTPHCP